MARPATGQVIEREGANGRSFALRFRAYGERQYVTLGSTADGWTRQRAEQELDNVLADVRRGIWRHSEPLRAAPAPVEVPTFHEFASEWFEARKHEWRPRTVDDYYWALTNHLLPFFATHRLSEITIAEVDRYRAAKLREGRLSAAIINKTLTRLTQILEVAVEYGHLPSNPAAGKRRRLKATTPHRSWLEPEQVKPLLDHAGRFHAGRGRKGQGEFRVDPRLRALYATLTCCGLRISEALALRWRDVDLAGGRLTVRAAKTDAGVRHVNLWPEIREELIAYKAQAGQTAPDAFVFGTSTGKPETGSNVARRLHRAVLRANEALADTETPLIDETLTPHSLRRTFASLLYLQGETPVYVMEQMGHTDPKLALRIYAKVIGDRRHHGKRLIGVLNGAEWARMGTNRSAEPVDAFPEQWSEQEKTPSERGFPGVGCTGLEPVTSGLSSQPDEPTQPAETRMVTEETPKREDGE